MAFKEYDKRPTFRAYEPKRICTGACVTIKEQERAKPI